jgi:uncharacterized membrane protein YhaH (DUF805 family)
MFAALKKYAVFEGRARRSEYWLFTLFQIIALIGAMVVGSVLDAAIGDSAPDGRSANMFAALLYLVVALGLFIPGLAVSVRRLHDSDKSGWFYLLAFVPFGGIVLLVFFCLDGTPGSNKYGPDPKGRGTAEAFA